MALVAGAQRMKTQQVSILIANYNGAKVLADCIDSVLNQHGNISCEIIVHDDASSDDSLSLLRTRYGNIISPRIEIVESKQNVGFCMANKRIAAQARGEYLLFLNNDAALAPDALQTLLAAAQQQFPQGILTLPQIDWESGVLVDRGCLLDPFYNPIPNLDPTRHDVGMVIGAALWIPRTLWEKLGGFPAWFESLAEDMQLCCYARLAGYPVNVTHSSHYRHRQGASFGGNRILANRLSSTYRRRRLSERNKTFVMVLCSPPLRLCLTLPIHLALLALEGILLAILKRDMRLWQEVYANVFTSLLRNGALLLKERKKIQKSRSVSARDYGKSFCWIPRKLQMLVRYGIPDLR
jgi:GT2 family glycosyltransferase